MTEEMLYESLKNKFKDILIANGLTSDAIKIESKSLTPEEAIGIIKRKDFPIITGKEVMLQAVYKEAFGQAFTEAPAVLESTLEEIWQMDLQNDAHARGLFIAALNAVLRYLGFITNTVHCKNEEPELCARDAVSSLKAVYGLPKIALVGYQPAMLEALAKTFHLRVLDLNPANIGRLRYGIEIENGAEHYQEVLQWSDLVLCTGSTLCNATIVNFMDLPKEVIFYGTTIAGAAHLLGLKRLCPMSL